MGKSLKVYLWTCFSIPRLCHGDPQTLWMDFVGLLPPPIKKTISPKENGPKILEHKVLKMQVQMTYLYAKMLNSIHNKENAF